MSFDDDKKRKEAAGQIHSLDAILNPNKLLEMRSRADMQRRKDLSDLKQQVERKQLLQGNDKDNNEKQGTGGLSGEEVVTADAKPDVKRQIADEKRQEQISRSTGQTEQSKSTP